MHLDQVQPREDDLVPADVAHRQTIKVFFEPLRMTRKGQLYRANLLGSVIVQEAYSPMKESLKVLRDSGFKWVRVEFYRPDTLMPAMIYNLD
jgi:hypothetical protein